MQIKRIKLAILTSGIPNMNFTSINIANENILKTKNSRNILRYLAVLGSLGKYDSSSKYAQVSRTTNE